MISNTIELDSASVRKLTNAMKELDDNSLNGLRKDLKTRIKPLGNEIAKKVPTESPFSGMSRNYYGRVQWSQPTAKVSVTPGKSTRQRGWASVVTLILEHKTRLGFNYVENAGPRRKSKKPMTRTYQRRQDSAPRQHTNSTQGDALIKKAKSLSADNYAAGHFAYGNFLRLKPVMIILAKDTLKKVEQKFNVKVGRR